MASKVQGNTKPSSTGKRLPPNAGKGRPKGSPNKATATAKEAIAMLADGMTGELQTWLRQAAHGVGVAYVPWEQPEDWDGPPPPGAKGKGKAIVVPVLGENGNPLPVSLADAMAGTLPPGATIEWVVRPQPGPATDTMLRALEYHIPKLSRAEVTGRDGKDLIPATINIKGVRAPRRE